jgi:hypothetical protein
MAVMFKIFLVHNNVQSRFKVYIFGASERPRRDISDRLQPSKNP